MVLDTSALLAILCGEPERQQFIKLLTADPTRLLSAANFLETGIVLENRSGDAAGRDFDLFLYRAAITVVPVDRDQAELARRAYRRFGKGRHPAALNYGDCFAYALSKSSGEPLLFKGDDFARTDVESRLG